MNDLRTTLATAIENNASDADLLALVRAHVPANAPADSPRKAGVLWEGPSPIDGAPIVAVVTVGTTNRKTGDVAQVWILRADMSPTDAVKSGADESICGKCPHRGRAVDGKLIDRSCYVLPFQAPSIVHRKYAAGGYRKVRPADFANTVVRWGAYGDPALLPVDLVREVNSYAASHLGYTHQWHRKFAAPFAGVFMASVDSPAQETRARAAGWGTFRVAAPDSSDAGEAILCDSEANGTSCATCRKCDGRPVSIYIPAHGVTAHKTPAARRARKSLPVVKA